LYRQKKKKTTTTTNKTTNTEKREKECTVKTHNEDEARFSYFFFELEIDSYLWQVNL